MEWALRTSGKSGAWFMCDGHTTSYPDAPEEVPPTDGGISLAKRRVYGKLYYCTFVLRGLDGRWSCMCRLTCDVFEAGPTVPGTFEVERVSQATCSTRPDAAALQYRDTLF